MIRERFDFLFSLYENDTAILGGPVSASMAQKLPKNHSQNGDDERGMICMSSSVHFVGVAICETVAIRPRVIVMNEWQW